MELYDFNWLLKHKSGAAKIVFNYEFLYIKFFL